jgi:hypothetical protein
MQAREAGDSKSKEKLSSKIMKKKTNNRFSHISILRDLRVLRG